MTGRAILSDLIQSGAIPDPDYVLNHLVNRIPFVSVRMRAYAAVGVRFDEVASTNISLGVEMWNGRGLVIGSRSTIGQHCYIDARAGIRVDSDVSISREVAVLTATHIPDDPQFAADVAPVHLGQHCFIGMRACVLPGVRIGEGAVVGAGAVVTTNVEPYTIVGGIPAKVLRKRPGPMSYMLDFRPSWY